jgi:hypothetical protein
MEIFKAQESVLHFTFTNFSSISNLLALFECQATSRHFIPPLNQDMAQHLLITTNAVS